MTNSRTFWKPVLFAFLAAALVAALGTSVTDLGPWYQNLKKPAWQPPDWLFGPAWTLIFACTALSAATAWAAARSQGGRDQIIIFFCLNGILNVVWSLLFFRQHWFGWAGVEVVCLWLSILALIILTHRISALAAWLLVPYLVWVAFAAIMNWAVVRLN